MKKPLASYVAVWAICLLLFNGIAFIVPRETNTNFWVGYAFITVAFVGQLLCGALAFKANNAQQWFYRFPLISISFVGVLLMLIIGGLTIAISAVPVWIGVIACLAVLAFTAIAVINASIAGDTVSNIDRQIRAKTMAIKTLIADAERIMRRADAEATKAIAKQVYEAIRYSDPMRDEALRAIESRIEDQFREFATAVSDGADNAVALGEDLITLIEERNVKCKLLK